MQQIQIDNLTRIERGLEDTSMEGLTTLALAAIPMSLALYASGRREAGLLVGMWAPTLLTAAFYNRWLRFRLNA